MTNFSDLVSFPLISSGTYKNDVQPNIFKLLASDNSSYQIHAGVSLFELLADGILLHRDALVWIDSILNNFGIFEYS